MDDNFWFQIDSEMIKKIQQGVYYHLSIVPGFEPIKIDSLAWHIYGDNAMSWKNKYFKSQDVLDRLNWMFRHHIISHAGYYTSLPYYYFDQLTTLN